MIKLFSEVKLGKMKDCFVKCSALNSINQVRICKLDRPSRPADAKLPNCSEWWKLWKLKPQILEILRKSRICQFDWMQRQTDQDDKTLENWNLSKSIGKVSRFKVYHAKITTFNLSTNFKNYFTLGITITIVLEKELGLAVISKC